EVRLPARRAEVRRAAPWWPGLRPGSPGDADDRCAVDPRSDRLPENPERGLCHDPGARGGGWQVAARAAHSPARATQGRISLYKKPGFPGFFVMGAPVRGPLQFHVEKME